MDTEPREHQCRGKTKQSDFQEPCTQKIHQDKYEQGIRYCRRHLDQQDDNDEASSTDSQGQEQTAVSGRQGDHDADGGSRTNPQIHPAPIIYISGNSTRSTGNPRATEGHPQPHQTSPEETKQRRQAQPVEPQPTSVSSRVGPDHGSSSGRRSVRENGPGHTERQEASNTQRTAQIKRSLDSPSNPPAKSHGALAAQVPTSREDNQFKQHSRSQNEMRRVASGSAYSRAVPGQRRQSIGPFQSFRSPHSRSPSRNNPHSVPLYPLRSHTTRPIAPYKQAFEPSSAYPSATRELSSHAQSEPRADPSIPSTSYSRTHPAAVTYGSWKAANPTSLGRAEPHPPPLFQPPPTVFVHTTLPPSSHTSNTNTQPRSTQREEWPQAFRDQTSQTQALDSTLSRRGTSVFPVDLSTDHFSFQAASNQAQGPGSPPKNVAGSTDHRNPWELDRGNGRRQTRVSAPQIQQQFDLVCESWEGFSAEVKDLIGMLPSE